MICLLASVLVFGREVNGARSWFELGGIRIQPAEFAKFATALAVDVYKRQVLILAEAFTFANINITFMRILCSSIVSYVFILLYYFIAIKKKQE